MTKKRTTRPAEIPAEKSTAKRKRSAKATAEPKAEEKGRSALATPGASAVKPRRPAKTAAAKKATGPQRPTKASAEESRREGGLPGGGQGRIDAVGRSGVYPGSGPYPSGEAESRTPASFVHGQTDAEGRPVEGGSELTYFEGRTLLGGATPTPSGPPEGQTRAKE